VQSGVVTLGGHARTYVDKDSTLSLVSTYPGVKDVIDAVYGYPSLNKYAIDPAKPIRISIQNGNAALYGMVDSQADKDTSFHAANGVPGVFSVKNYLQVAGQPAESQK
jgi:hyperosmotically inducible periplasmic protein